MEPPEDSSDEDRAGPLMEHPEDLDSDDEERAVSISTTEHLDDLDDEDIEGTTKGNEILDVMMPMLSGGKDDFGKELVPPLPFLFDRVSEGRMPVSGTKLLTIPLEVLALIVRKIPATSLASLALVNSDCRQLA